jgi:hypothetical protein
MELPAYVSTRVRPEIGVCLDVRRTLRRSCATRSWLRGTLHERRANAIRRLAIVFAPPSACSDKRLSYLTKTVGGSIAAATQSRAGT